MPTDPGPPEDADALAQAYRRIAALEAQIRLLEAQLTGYLQPPRTWRDVGRPGYVLLWVVLVASLATLVFQSTR